MGKFGDVSRKRHLAAWLLFAGPLLAHHSFAGAYLEEAPPVVIEGQVVQFLFRNPHSMVRVETKDSKTGEVIEWSAEWASAAQLAQQGVGRKSLKPGDKVKITGSPGREAAEHRLRLRNISRPSDRWSWGLTGR